MKIDAYRTRPNIAAAICGGIAAVPVVVIDTLPSWASVALVVVAVACNALAGNVQTEDDEESSPPRTGREAVRRWTSITLVALGLAVAAGCGAAAWQIHGVDVHDGEVTVVDGEIDVSGTLRVCAEVRGRVLCEDMRMTLLYAPSAATVTPCIIHPWLPGGLQCWPLAAPSGGGED